SSAGSPLETSQSVAALRFSTSASSSAPGGSAPGSAGSGSRPENQAARRPLGRVGGQAAGGVLAQQLVHAVAPVLTHLDQGVVDQAGQQRQPGPGHGGGRAQGESAPPARRA